MITPKFRAVAKTTISAMALAGVVFAGSLWPQQAQAQVYRPAYTATNVLGGNQPTGSPPSSFGFFFDVVGDATMDGLGFAAQAGWDNGTQYNVNLWKYTNAAANINDFTLIANATFTAGDPYTLQDDFYWQTIAGGPIDLPDTYTYDPGDLEGYVIAAIGDFTDTPGNVAFETGDTVFDPRILNAGNGFNEDGVIFYPVPIGDAGIGTSGYFNANISLLPVPPVPGPLPMLGAAAGFAWTRRLRKRIRTSN